MSWIHHPTRLLIRVGRIVQCTKTYIGLTPLRSVTFLVEGVTQLNSPTFTLDFYLDPTPSILRKVYPCFEKLKYKKVKGLKVKKV